MTYVEEEYRLLIFYTREFNLHGSSVARARNAMRSSPIDGFNVMCEAHLGAVRLICAAETMLEHGNKRMDSIPKAALTAFMAWQDVCRAASAVGQAAEASISSVMSSVPAMASSATDPAELLAKVEQLEAVRSESGKEERQLRTALLNARKTLDELEENLGLATSESNEIVSRASSFVDTVRWQPGQALWDSP